MTNNTFYIIAILLLLKLSSAKLNRTERALIFPDPSTVGILVAIAVPISNVQKDVFVSYNFEANYNSPGLATDFTRPLKKYDIPAERKTRSEYSLARRKGILTRLRIYHLIETKLTAHGFPGRSCLLRAICEAAETPLGIVNGVLGDILHIVLTPTTSEYENLPEIFYEAEFLGTMELCEVFHKDCPQSVLDLISIFV